MPVSELPIDVEAYTIAIISISCFVFSIVISIYHLFNVNKHIGHKAFEWQYLKQNLTIFLSYLLLLSGIMIGVSSTLGVVIGLHSAAFCNYQKHIGPAMYLIFKTILYLLLLCRTWQVFNSSIFAYNTKKLLIYAAILILWTVINIAMNSFGVVVKINDKYPRCLVFASTTFIMSSILCDFVSGIIGIILFVKPIISLAKNTEFDIEIRNCALQQTILAVIAILSTLLLLTCIGLFNAPKLFSSLDIMISTLSMVYMHKWHTNFIAKIFFCCIHPKQKVADLKNLEIVNRKDNSHNTQTTTTVTVGSTNTVTTATTATV